METVSRNICERISCSPAQKFQPAIMTGCHLFNKSSCKMSSLLNIPQAAISGGLTEWKQLGMIAAQPWNGRPCKVTDQGQQMRRSIARRGQQRSGRVRRELNEIPYSSCTNAVHHQVQYRASAAEVWSTPPLDSSHMVPLMLPKCVFVATLIGGTRSCGIYLAIIKQIECAYLY